MCGAPPAAVPPSNTVAIATGGPVTIVPTCSAAQPSFSGRPAGVTHDGGGSGGSYACCCSGDASFRGGGKCCGANEFLGAAPVHPDAAAAEELELVRQERDDALQLVRELSAQAAGLLVTLDERCVELSHVCRQRDLLRRQLDANRAAMVHCAGLLAKGRPQECIRLALAVAGVQACRPDVGGGGNSGASATVGATGVPVELLGKHGGWTAGWASRSESESSSSSSL